MYRILSVVAVVAALSFAACGDAALPPETGSDLGGDRLPVQHPDEPIDHAATPLTGVFVLQGNGCWTADLGDVPRLVAFPVGYTKPADDGTVMRGPDGTTVASGMAFDAVGGVVRADLLPVDGYWGNYVAFCDLPEIVVLDSLAPAFRPDDLDEAGLVAMLREADLSVSWPCGLGFTVSTSDQRVALFVHPRAAATGQPVALPDDRWEAVVRVGKNLLVNNCDDVVEGWEPQPLIVATWPVVSGSLEFAPPVDGSCGGGEPVDAVLRAVQVETPAGIVDLGDLTATNTAYGCFAG